MITYSSPMRALTQLIFSMLALTLFAFCAASANAWGGKTVTGSGKVVEDTRLVSGFSQIEVKSAMDVELRQSGREAVTIIADDNIAPLIRAQVSGKTLVIDTNASWSTRVKMRIVVDVISLTAVKVSGAGDVRAVALKTPELIVGISGSGDIFVEKLETESLSVSISGSGDFRSAGSARTQSYSIAGSGDIRADGLEGEKVNVKIAGSGDARVWAKTSLDASVMGSGDVRYKGKPTNVKKNVLGSGEIAEL